MKTTRKALIFLLLVGVVAATAWLLVGAAGESQDKSYEGERAGARNRTPDH